MTPEACYFFATRADLEPGLRSAERQHSLQYVLTGLFPTPELSVFTSALDIPDLGIARWGQSLGENCYLVLQAVTPFRTRPVPQRRGGMLYAVDSVGNPSGILLRAGGIFEDRCLISGEVAAVGDPRSLEMFAAFARELLRGFARIQAFSVGPEAVELLDGGMRLTQDVRAPAECDLKRPDPSDQGGVSTGPRLPIEASWEHLRSRGFEPPEDSNGRPLIPVRMPNYDDPVLGLTFFRTSLDEVWLENLSLPRTYFGRSEFRRVSFRNTDLSESRMCWNDWLECDFTRADLTRADLRASEYIRCSFAAACLIGADMRWSAFAECDFARARLSKAKLTRRQGAQLELTRSQRGEIDWQEENGPEPPDG